MNDDCNVTSDDRIQIIDHRSQIIDESTVPRNKKGQAARLASNQVVGEW
jgi:hypothetical protein